METVKVHIDYEHCAYILTLINADGSDGPDLLVQSDWYYPAFASALGLWRACHNCTDGTVNCPECGNTASDMITAASEALSDHCGCIVSVPPGAIEDYFYAEDDDG